MRRWKRGEPLLNHTKVIFDQKCAKEWISFKKLDPDAIFTVTNCKYNGYNSDFQITLIDEDGNQISITNCSGVSEGALIL